MSYARGDGLPNLVVEPSILIWNFKPWLNHMELSEYANLFDGFRFQDLFSFDQHFFTRSGIPDHIAQQFRECIRGIFLQCSRLEEIRKNMARKTMSLFTILNLLQKFLPAHPVPLIGPVPRMFIKILENVYHAISTDIKSTFEGCKCKQLVYSIVIRAVRNPSFLAFEVSKLQVWRKECANISPYSR